MRGENSLVVQWLGLHASTAGVMGSVSGWGAKISHTAWYSQNFFKNLRPPLGTSLAIQWLRLRLWKWVQVQSLLGEIRFHMPHDQKTKTQTRSNIVRNSIKDFKNGPHQKKKKKHTKKYPAGDTDAGSPLLHCVWKLPRRRKCHSSFLAWRIPCTEEPGRLQAMWLQRVRHDWATNTSPSCQLEKLWEDSQLLAAQSSCLWLGPAVDNMGTHPYPRHTIPMQINPVHPTTSACNSLCPRSLLGPRDPLGPHMAQMRGTSS